MKHFLADSSASFYTTGDGLKGVPVLVMDRDDGTLIHARVHHNTSTRLYLDTPLSRNPDRYDAYLLGSIPLAIESGDLTFGNPREYTSISYFTFEFERGSVGHLVLYLAADQESQTNTAWQFAGNVPLKGRTQYRLPITCAAGRGRVIRYLLMGTRPGQVTTITHLSIDFTQEGNFL